MKEPTAQPQYPSQEESMAAVRARRWEPESERSHWVAALVLGTAVLALAWWALSPPDDASPDEDPASPAGAAAPADAAPVLLPPMRPDSPSPAVPRSPGQVAIYECVQGGQKILSDRPCGADAVERIVDMAELNTYREVPLPPASVRPSGQPLAVNSNPAVSRASPSGSDKAALCEQLQARIDRINARTRQKHSHQEGEYWRREWHEAKNAYYDADCGRP